MPRDTRPFITVAVDMDRNPKYAALNDAQKFLIIRAWLHCAEFLTDGVISMAAWRKMGTDRNRKAILAAGACSEDAEQNCVVFHDYLEHQQSRADVESKREKARSAGQKGGQAKAANAKRNHRRNPSSGLADARDFPSGSVPDIDIEEEVLTYVPSAALVSNARELENTAAAAALDEPGRKVDIDGWKLIKGSCNGFPQATRTALATHAGAMLKQGIAAEDIAAGLERWLAKDLGPSQFPHFVTDVIRARTRPATVASPDPGALHLSNHDRKTLGWDAAATELKRSLGIVPGQQNALPSNDNRPLLGVIDGDYTEQTA
ncbi:hypothetical protein ACFXG4_04180 [Nocardia sp. NPDC059246]|uniref:hypothetical protein n=1 Tax=unclassified Nocardia TaxID=2637762 RepID=UPI00369D45FF